MVETTVENEKYRLTIKVDQYCESPREWDNIGTVVMFNKYEYIGDEHNYGSPREFLIQLIKDALYDNNELNLPEDVLVKALDYYIDNLPDKYYLNISEKILLDMHDTMTYQHKAIAGNILLDDYVDVVIEALEDFSLKELEDIIYSFDYYVILPIYLYDHSGITISTGSFSCPWDSGQAGWIYATMETFLKETGYTEEQLFKEGKAEEILSGEVKTLDMYLQGYVYYFLLEEKETCEHCNHVEYKHVDSCGGFYANTAEELAKEIAGYLPEEAESLLEGLL